MFGAGESMKKEMGRYVRPESPTLRDQFAMAALMGLLANNDSSGTPLAFAVTSYALADAMEVARNKESGE